MANAAAKKAAAARASASSTYFPLVVSVNILYVVVRVAYKWSTFDTFQMCMSALLVALSYFAYQGILDDHENQSTASSSKKGLGGKSDALAGGASLDLLGLVVVVQFGSALFSDNFYWLLIVLPFWGAWKLYSTFFGSGEGSMGGLMGSGGSAEPQKETPVDEATAAKRKKRAERRRMKWS